MDDLPANIMLVRIVEQLRPRKPSESLDAESNEKRSDQVKAYLVLNGFVLVIVFAILVESLVEAWNLEVRDFMCNRFSFVVVEVHVSPLTSSHYKYPLF